VILALAGAEVLFKLLIGYSYLDLAEVHTAAQRNTALVWYAAVSAPFTAAFFAALVRLLEPVRRWNRDVRAGAASDRVVARAGEALHLLPGRVAVLWTLEWSGTFAVLLTVRHVTCVEAGALFFSTMVTAPIPVAASVVYWLAAPSMRRAALAARDRAIALALPAMPLRRRLAALGVLSAIAPSTYIASLAFSAQASHLSRHDLIAPLVVCCVAIVAFALIGASLTAARVTGAVASMAEVIREIARQGDGPRIARLPQHLQDEVGGLATSINEMIDRLERTATERAAMSESLEALNQVLERRVLERTMRLFEANSVLQGEMAARAKVEIELRHAQKLEAVGRLAAGIAHEINTPVQFVSDSVQFVTAATADLLALVERYQGAIRAVRAGAPGAAEVQAVEAAEQAADLDYIITEIPSALALARGGLDRVREITRSMKTFAHHDQDMRDADLNQAILSTLTIANHEYKYVAQVDTELGDIPLVHCHAGEINQVVLNLLVNAAHAIADHRGDGDPLGRIGVRTTVDGDDVVIAVSDTGGGVPEHIQHRIFDPFFTTKDVNRGTGQGLAIARAVIAEKHGGTLTFTTERGVGSTFTIRLPIHGGPVRALGTLDPELREASTTSAAPMHAPSAAPPAPADAAIPGEPARPASGGGRGVRA
jgi:signal transduction histidine kinase